jgi:hypothetical protein
VNTALEAIGAALASDATPEIRAAGATACRAILAALEPQPATAAQPVVPPIASIVSALRGVPPDQLLDLAIAKLRAALPAGTESAPVAPIKFHIVPVSPAARKP